MAVEQLSKTIPRREFLEKLFLESTVLTLSSSLFYRRLQSVIEGMDSPTDQAIDKAITPNKVLYYRNSGMLRDKEKTSTPKVIQTEQEMVNRGLLGGLEVMFELTAIRHSLGAIRQLFP